MDEIVWGLEDDELNTSFMISLLGRVHVSLYQRSASHHLEAIGKKGAIAGSIELPL